jgi:hypothetical protein
MRAVSDALPGHLDIAPHEVRPLLEGLTDAAMDLAVRLTPEADLTDAPDELRLANGRSVFERPGSARYASVGQLAADNALRQAAVLRGAFRSATTRPKSCSTGSPRPGARSASTRRLRCAAC